MSDEPEKRANDQEHHGIPSENPDDATRTTKRNLTPDEQWCVDQVAKCEGREWADSHIDLIIDQARAIGTI